MTGDGDYVITTGLQAGCDTTERAATLSRRLGQPFVPRRKQGLEELRRQSGAWGVIVVSRRRIKLVYTGREFFFHPGLAKLRIREILAGKTDQMVKAMGLQPGDRVLDCTLGLAADALVAGYVVGDKGRVTGLEVVPVVALLIRCGLEDFRFHSSPLGEAMRRVEVLTADHQEYLVSCETGSYDIVYFDPMFRVPRLASSGMESLRLLAESAAVSPETVREAVRVARRRVVLKERRDSPEFQRLGFERLEGGRYSPVAYAVIEKGGGPG